MARPGPTLTSYLPELPSFLSFSFFLFESSVEESLNTVRREINLGRYKNLQWDRQHCQQGKSYHFESKSTYVTISVVFKSLFTFFKSLFL